MIEIQVDWIKTCFIEVIVFETLKSTLHMLWKQIGVSYPNKKFILLRVHKSTESMKMDGFVADTMWVHSRYYGTRLESQHFGSQDRKISVSLKVSLFYIVNFNPVKLHCISETMLNVFFFFLKRGCLQINLTLSLRLMWSLRTRNKVYICI